MKRAHRNLKAWQQAMELVTAIYNATSSFPAQEKFGLSSQLQRAAGSLSELDTLIELAARVGYLNNAEELNGKVDEVSGLLMGLSASIKRRTTS